MKNLAKKFSQLVAVGVMTIAFAGPAHAVPIEASIDISGPYSLLHPITDAGFGDSADWLWFDAGQTLSLDLDLTNNMVTLFGGPQSFTLASNNGAIAGMDIVGLNMDLNDSDGFLSGAMDYLLDGTAGTFNFTNQNYGNTPFNSSNISDGVFSLFVWGGDDVNGIGIDLGVSAPVPEPATWMLILAGITGLWFSRRQRA